MSDTYRSGRGGLGKPFVIRMDDELHAAIKAKAASEERSMAQMIRYALKLYVSQRYWVDDGGVGRPLAVVDEEE